MNRIQVFNGRLMLDGIDVKEAAERFGTPMYLYAGDSIRAGVRVLKEALVDVEVYYSIKANPALGVCRVIQRAGVDGAEIASSGELVSAIASGFDPKQILFAGPGKTDEELEHAIRMRVGQINAESEGELTRIDRIASAAGVVQRVGIRVNSEAHDAGHGKIQTAGGAQKFGIDESRVGKAIQSVIECSNLEFAGLHTMLGSQVLDENEMLSSCQRAMEMAVRIGKAAGIEIPSLNFGGGLGVAHSDDDPRFDLVNFGRGLSAIINEAKQQAELVNTRFVIEPGRILVSAHGVYLSRVIDVKESGGRCVAVLDGGIHHALLPITANSYQILVVDRCDDEHTSPVMLGGPLCTSADQWRAEVSLPGVRVGDILAMMNSGAYGLSASMTMFLSRGVPAEVLVLEGQCSILRDRSAPEAVLDGQRIPESLD